MVRMTSRALLRSISKVFWCSQEVFQDGVMLAKATLVIVAGKATVATLRHGSNCIVSAVVVITVVIVPVTTMMALAWELLLKLCRASTCIIIVAMAVTLLMVVVVLVAMVVLVVAMLKACNVWGNTVYWIDLKCNLWILPVTMIFQACSIWDDTFYLLDLVRNLQNCKPCITMSFVEFF